MTLAKLKTSEQILLAVVITSLILGGYGFFRFIPKNKAVNDLQNHVTQTENKLRTTRIPDEPGEDIKALLKELDDQEKTIAMTNTMAEEITGRLADFNSQELRLLVSELARNSGVHIHKNEKFTPKLLTNNPTIKKKKKKKTRIATPLVDVILPASQSWIDRMSAVTPFHRPMQHLVLNGEYEQIRAFIHGLEGLPWQVTVVRLQVKQLPTSPLRGYAQSLQADLILAL